MGVKTSEFLREFVTPSSPIETKDEYDNSILYCLGYDDGASELMPRIGQRDFETYMMGWADGMGDKNG